MSLFSLMTQMSFGRIGGDFAFKHCFHALNMSLSRQATYQNVPQEKGFQMIGNTSTYTQHPHGKKRKTSVHNIFKNFGLREFFVILTYLKLLDLENFNSV